MMCLSALKLRNHSMFVLQKEIDKRYQTETEQSIQLVTGSCFCFASFFLLVHALRPLLTVLVYI